jgi:hypothetical protein
VAQFLTAPACKQTSNHHLQPSEFYHNLGFYCQDVPLLGYIHISLVSAIILICDKIMCCPSFITNSAGGREAMFLPTQPHHGKCCGVDKLRFVNILSCFLLDLNIIFYLPTCSNPN